MKIVINRCYGGFNLSEEALDYMGIPYKVDFGFAFPANYGWLGSLECRTNSKLIEFIEKSGSERASGRCSKLVVEEIPQGTLFRIEEYDGMESIETQDNIDWQVAI